MLKREVQKAENDNVKNAAIINGYKEVRKSDYKSINS